MAALLWAHPRDAAADFGNLLWRQLVLLGFNPAEYARKEGVRDPDALGPRMFHTQSPNRGGLFCILHFLFSTYSDDFAKAIAPCFPTFDAEGKKEFRNVAQKLIQSLCDAQLLPKECGIRAGSVLNVPEGVRAYQLSLQIATVVTLRVLQLKHRNVYKLQASVTDETGCGRPSTCSTKAEMVSVCRALQLRAFRDCRRFQQRTADIVAAQEAWLATADRLRDDYVRVTSSVDSRSPAGLIPSPADIERVQASVDCAWNALKTFCESADFSEAQAAMSVFLERQKHPLSHRIDSGPLKVALSTVGLETESPGTSLLAQSVAAYTSYLQVLSEKLVPSTAGESTLEAPLPWVSGGASHVSSAAEAVAHAAANLKVLNETMRDEIRRLKRLSSESVGDPPGFSTPARITSRSSLAFPTPTAEYAPFAPHSLSFASPDRS